MNCISFISFPNWDSTVSCKRWVFNKYLSPEKHSIWQMCRRRMLPFYYKLFFLEIEYKLMIMSLNDAKLYRKKSSPPSFLFIILSPPLPTTSKYITNFFFILPEIIYTYTSTYVCEETFYFAQMEAHCSVRFLS